MRILFIHKNFPAQFGAFGLWLSKQGWDVSFATERADATATGMNIEVFKSGREPTKGIHRYVANLESAIIDGQGFARTAVAMRNKGYRPDIVVAHSGWGVGSFAKDVWPDCKYVPYFEWFYRSPSQDVTPHDAPQGDPLDHAAKTRVRNMPFWLDFSAADAALCPTRFQACQFPQSMRRDITVLHDGIDTDLHCAGPRDPALMAELGIPDGAKVLTWVTRGMEPARGFPEMMAAVADLQVAHPDMHTVIVGQDRVAYGAKGGPSWKERMLAEHSFDLSRLHFTGLVSRNRMIKILQAGDVHLHLTAPFVLSWSLLDAMACGCRIVVSDVEPVREFLADGQTATLVDTYDKPAIVAAVTKAIETPEEGALLRHAARDVIRTHYDAHSVIYPAKKAFLTSLV